MQNYSVLMSVYHKEDVYGERDEEEDDDDDFDDFLDE